MQGELDFGVKCAARAAKPEQLHFVLLPEEADALKLAQFAQRVVADNELGLTPLKSARLHIALARVGPVNTAVLYGAKLAGQVVAAAGLRICLDTIGSLGGPSGRALALTGSDPALAQLQSGLAAAMQRNGLRTGEPFRPYLALAYGAARFDPQAIAPVSLTLAGLALLRGEGRELAVVRRWPLNKPRAPYHILPGRKES